MIELFKMGKRYYLGGVDKNSGLTEVSLIQKEVNKIQTKKNILLIINGVRDDEDIKYLKERMQSSDLNIFIMSDSIAIKSNLDIINACDICLHQGINYYFDEITCRQYYSYVPELFYKNAKEKYRDQNVFKTNAVLFGGNNLDRQDKFNDYEILDSAVYKAFVKLYDKDGIILLDNRIDYSRYLDELASCKYSLVICREEYRESNWITSRFFESVALKCLPIIDEDYCREEYAMFPIKVHDHDSMIKFIDLCEKDDNRERLLKFYNKTIMGRVNGFCNQLDTIMRNYFAFGF